MYIDLYGLREHTKDNPKYNEGYNKFARSLRAQIARGELPPDIVVDKASRRPFYKHDWYEHFINPSELRNGENVIRLTPVINKLLVVLEREPNRIIGHERIISDTWGYSMDKSERIKLRVAVQHLRANFLRLGVFDPIMSEHGVGYGLIDPSKPS